MFWVLVVGYLLLLAAALTFLAGASILNEKWDRDADRALRLARLFDNAA